MKPSNSGDLSRRDVLKKSGDAAIAAAAVGSLASTHLAAAPRRTIPEGSRRRRQHDSRRARRLRRSRHRRGASTRCRSTNGPIKLVAMADVFPEKLDAAYKGLTTKVEKDKLPGKVDVPEDQKFIGFDGYKKALDCLRPGDVAIFATPPAFRWVHFGAAIDKGINVFMEKPVTVDGPRSRKLLTLAEEVGEEEPQGRRRPDVSPLRRSPAIARPDQGRRNRRHHLDARLSPSRPDRQRLLRADADRIGTRASCCTRSRTSTRSCGPAAARYSDFLIHNIDECCWMKDAWPVEGRSLRRPSLSRKATSIRTSTPTR